MQSFADPSAQGQACPFEFNFDAATFKVGDVVSFRVPESFGDMPFIGTLVGVADDHVMIVCADNPAHSMRGTRTSRPEVSARDALG
jgi:hypothetical protein